MREHTVGPEQLRGLAFQLRETHPGYGEFITKLEAADALGQYAREMEEDTLRAAAPDMLEALKAVDNHLRTTFPPYAKGERPFDKVRAAITRAEL